MFITFRKVGALRERIVHSVIPRRSGLVVPVLGQEAVRETLRMTGQHHPNLKVKSHAFYLQRANVPEQIVRTNMIAVLHQQRVDPRRRKLLLPKGRQRLPLRRPKLPPLVVQVKREDDNGFLSDWSDNEESSPVAAGKLYRMRRASHVVKDKVVKIRRKPEMIHIDVGMNTTGLPKRTKKRENKPRYVKGDFLESETFKHQTAINQLIARAKAKVLNNEIMGRKPEIKVIIGKGMYVRVRWKNDEVLEEVMKMSNKKGKSKSHSCASAEPSDKSVRFIMDTGCGHDLISQRKVKELDLETFLDNDGMTFMTANGLTDSNEITIMEHEGLGRCKLHVLNQTPAVLSVGSRCSKEGYSFIWPKGEDMKPAMIRR